MTEQREVLKNCVSSASGAVPAFSSFPMSRYSWVSRVYGAHLVPRESSGVGFLFLANAKALSRGSTARAQGQVDAPL
ncbi:hypothetical protein HW555_001745 [Spodoptera exigua]|uniref:Uncharacterized protein n=1 Tax=Spodoptera exigua TaxID=7107 RepID=A0A835GRP5_SPOEX|nr:hypothetical protein HW555_001745 [Spodoptera exigua]